MPQTPSDYQGAACMFESEYIVEEVPGGHFMHREHPEAWLLAPALPDGDASVMLVSALVAVACSVTVVMSGAPAVTMPPATNSAAAALTAHGDPLRGRFRSQVSVR